MQPKAKLYRYRADSPLPVFSSRSCLFILLANWLFQGVRGMDAKELGFRLLLLFVVAGLSAWLSHLAFGLSGLGALALGLSLGHTFNFLLNGQFWVCLRYCPAYRRDPAVLGRAVEGLVQDLQRRRWLDEAVIIGSLATRPRLPAPRADIDVRLIFPAGIGNWLRTNLLLLRLRAKAFLRGLPLDIYAYEHPALLRRFDQSEPLGIILDRGSRLRRGFANRRLVWLQ
jgi:hypothetical protein